MDAEDEPRKRAEERAARYRKALENALVWLEPLQSNLAGKALAAYLRQVLAEDEDPPEPTV